jgi:hypothetical protein
VSVKCAKSVPLSQDDDAVTETAADDWAGAKKRQADEADYLAAVASGIGEYQIANACYRLAAILRQHAEGGLRQHGEGEWFHD